MRLAPAMEYGLLMFAVMAGFVVAVPAVVWGIRDICRIPHWVWRTQRSKEERWLIAMLVGSLLAGWPGVFVVLAWKNSHRRVVLLEDWERLERV